MSRRTSRGPNKGRQGGTKSRWRMQREPNSQRNKLCEAKGRSCNVGVPRTRGVEVIKNETKQMNVTYKEPRIKQAGTRTRKVRVKGGAAKEQDVLCSGAMQPSSCSSFLRQWWDLKSGLGCIRARDPVHTWQRAHHARRGARLYNQEDARTRIILSRKELALTALNFDSFWRCERLLMLCVNNCALHSVQPFGLHICRDLI